MYLTFYFNSRPSARGDGMPKHPFIRHWKFQFTPLREGRRGRIWQLYLNDFISIHAPPRGATLPTASRRRNVLFQFTPLREGRRSCQPLKMSSDSYFNSRPSARGDAHSKVSNQARHLFQFTPLREGRPIEMDMTVFGFEFQFTPLREGRQQKICNFCKSFVQPLQISMA